MQPIIVDSKSLEKTRTSSCICVNCFENVVKRRTIALLVILAIQCPVLYYLYNSEMSTYFNNQVRFTPIQINATRNATILTSTTTLLDKLYNTEIPEPNKNGIPVHKPPIKITVQVDNNKVPENGDKKTESNLDTNKSNDNLENKVDNIPEVEIKTTTVPPTTTTTKVVKETEKEEILPTCPETPPGLQGPLAISFAHEAIPFEKLNENLPLISDGGHFKPPYCIAKDKVAIIIPFRDREEHLRYFLEYMHPILSRQQIEYRIYIINQFGNGKFNRAKLMNVGFAESLKDLDFGCFVFHDVDLILENDKSIYSCPERPRHLSAGVDKFNYKLPYSTIFGGVTELTKGQMEKVNGFSNRFWGWGGEDDDMFNRIRIRGLTIMRYPMDIARYKMITHQREIGNEANPQRFDLIRQTGATMDHDGINSLKYKVVARENHQLYTNITVDLFNP